MQHNLTHVKLICFIPALNFCYERLLIPNRVESMKALLTASLGNDGWIEWYHFCPIGHMTDSKVRWTNVVTNLLNVTRFKGGRICWKTTFVLAEGKANFITFVSQWLQCHLSQQSNKPYLLFYWLSRLQRLCKTKFISSCIQIWTKWRDAEEEWHLSRIHESDTTWERKAIETALTAPAPPLSNFA